MNLDDSLRNRLVVAWDAMAMYDLKVARGVIAGHDPGRWRAIKELDDARHAIILAVLNCSTDSASAPLDKP